MNDIRETTLEHTAGSDYFTFYSSEAKWIRLVRRLSEQYPQEVQIIYENPDGSIVVHIPASWLRIKPKKRVAMTPEQIAELKARLEAGRTKRLEKNGDGGFLDKREDADDGEKT